MSHPPNKLQACPVTVDLTMDHLLPGQKT